MNECFSTCHRKHSSITGIPKHLPSFPIFRKRNIKFKKVNYEFKLPQALRYLVELNFYKIKNNRLLFENLYSYHRRAMANTFLASSNLNIGSSLHEKSMIKNAKNFIDNYSDKIELQMMFL